MSWFCYFSLTFLNLVIFSFMKMLVELSKRVSFESTLKFFNLCAFLKGKVSSLVIKTSVSCEVVPLFLFLSFFVSFHFLSMCPFDQFWQIVPRVSFGGNLNIVVMNFPQHLLPRLVKTLLYYPIVLWNFRQIEGALWVVDVSNRAI